jgi:hypothetical protein
MSLQKDSPNNLPTPTSRQTHFTTSEALLLIKRRERRKWRDATPTRATSGRGRGEGGREKREFKKQIRRKLRRYFNINL